jgi:hypothetical protein
MHEEAQDTVIKNCVHGVVKSKVHSDPPIPFFSGKPLKDTTF